MKPTSYLLILAAFLCFGCASPGHLQPSDLPEVVATAVVNTAWVQVASPQPQPGPSPNPNPGKICPQCQGTGKNPGDGRIITKCLMCNGKGRITSGVDMPVSGADEQADQVAIAVVDSPAQSLPLCQCRDCTCDDKCECNGGKCQCPHCYDAGHKLRDYAAAYHLAKTERIGLLVCVGNACDPLECELEALKRGLIACRSWEGCDSSPGCYAYLWSNDGRLLLADSQPATNRTKQVQGGRIMCGPSGCRFVPDEMSSSTNFSAVNNWNSFGGSCASGSCGNSSRTFRRWGR